MLASVERFIVPSDVRAATEQHLQQAGRDRFELFVLWTGCIKGPNFEVEHAYVPDQRSYREDGDLMVHVEGPALFELNRWLYERKQLLGAQVHTHPTTAYHSDVDNEFPIMTTIGGLSIVLPNFGDGGLLAHGVVAFRLSQAGWIQLADDFIGRVVELSD
jgi:hypothetical protein